MDSSQRVPRSERVPLKHPLKRQEYTEEEIQGLKNWWTQKDVDGVAEWLDGGTEGDPPTCVEVHEEKIDGNMEKVHDLRGINLSGKLRRDWTDDDSKITLSFARLDYANLQGGHLERAYLARAWLDHADLRGAHLKKASFASARLDDADLRRADLTDANLPKTILTKANIRGARFIHVYVAETVFRDVLWEPEASLFEGFDVRGIRCSDPLFDQFVRQSEFIRRCRETWPKWVFWPWKKTCDCGRNVPKWLVTCALVMLAFAFLFTLSGWLGVPLLRPRNAEIGEGFLTHLYFSVVTFSTLGFGDVTPCNWGGKIAVIVEVFFGYVMLGMLISIFTMKLVPPR